MVDTRDLKSLGSNAVRVRVPPRAKREEKANRLAFVGTRSEMAMP